jgi:signal transduction histidine kinase
MRFKALKTDIQWPFLLLILMVFLLILAGGYLFYIAQKNKIVYEKQIELSAISSLKIEEIQKWRMEHLRDGRILSNIIPRNKIIFDFLADGKSPALRQELMQRMKIFIENYDYENIFLYDTTGTVILSFPPLDTTLSNSFSDSYFDSLNYSDINLSDLRFSKDLLGIIHVVLRIPLFSEEKNEKVKVGTLLLMINPEKTLFPLIQSWPTPSKTSETLLVRQEGDSILFLNELRHKNNTALKFKLPVSKELPASVAVSGYEGVFEGLDYRGVPVISFLKKIPDSPWFMVAKVDKKEIYSPLNELIITILIIAFLIFFSVSSIIIYIWRNQRIRYLNELNSTKDKFFSIVSHDLRSPFTSINGFANLLIEDLHEKNLSTIKHYAEMILTSSENVIDLLGDLTEWSRVNTGRLKFNPREIDIVSVINEVVELMSAPALHKSITIIKKTPTHLKVYADKEMISSVFRNLISNSIKFSNPGGKVYILASEKADKVVVEVTDFGVGMKKETIEKLFRIGEDVSTPGTQKEKGTGLGLILVKEFISMHRGEVNVESKVGECSSFMVTLPL